MYFILATNSVLLCTKSNKKAKRLTAVPTLEMKLKITTDSEAVNLKR
jgi:hypothetical protein